MTPPKYTIKDISSGAEFEVYRNGGIICSCGTEQLAKDLVRDLETLGESLSHCHEDCRMALSGEWDKSDDGFKATKDSCMDALLLVGWEMEDFDYKTSSFEDEDEDQPTKPESES